MSGAVALFLAVAAGGGLGLFYFGGLWLTVRQFEHSRKPALLFGTSLVLRLSLTVLGFYFVMGGEWQRALACLVGFIIARRLLTAYTEPAPSGAQGEGG